MNREYVAILRCSRAWLIFCFMSAVHVSLANEDLQFEVIPRANKIEADGKLIVDARLTNNGDDSLQVYYGNYAYPEMYHFDIRHLETGLRLPATRVDAWDRSVPPLAQARYFQIVAPGEHTSFTIHLANMPGSNCQHVVFRRSGAYEITPALRVTTNRLESGAMVAGAWTGELKAKPFRITVTEPINVRQGFDVSGTVKAHDGQPVQNAIVQVFNLIPGGGFYPSKQLADQIHTDNDGHFQLYNIPEESGPYHLIVAKPSLPTKVVDITEAAVADPDGIKIIIDEPIMVRGQVVGEAGEPLVGVRVDRTHTTVDGRFELIRSKEEREIQLNVWRRGFGHVTARVEQQKAVRGDWKIVLHHEDSLRVTGVAKFLNGSPVVESRIEFQLDRIIEPKPQYAPSRTVQTDTDGKFQFVLPDKVAYSAKATAHEPMDIGYGRRWHCSIEKVVGGGQPIEIVFDNRGRIVMGVFPAGPLPKPHQLTLQLVSKRNKQERVQVSQKLAAQQRGLVLKGLEPGDYRVDLMLEPLLARRWSANVTIPAKPPFTAKSTISIPDFPLGGIKAQLIMPDGKTPAGQVTMKVFNKNRSFGGVSNRQGQLHIPTLPAGPIWLTPVGKQGVAPLPIHGFEVAAGKTTDLGKIQLKRMADEYGWFEGSLRYEDGQPVRNVMFVGGYAGPDGGVISPIGFRRTGIEAGKFRLQWRKGRHELMFALNQNRDMHLHHPGFSSTNLVVDVDLKPGETLNRDIVFRRRQKKKNLKVTWHLEKHHQPQSLSVMVQQPDLRWIKDPALAGGPGAIIGTLGHVRPPNSYSFGSVPQGDCYVVLRDFNGGHFMVKQAIEGATQLTAEFDHSLVGGIRIAVTDARGKPIRGFGIRVEAKVARSYVPACVILPPAESSYQHPMVNETDQGAYQIDGLGPGVYRVKVSHGDWSHETDVTVKEKLTASVTLKMVASGKPVQSVTTGD